MIYLAMLDDGLKPRNKRGKEAECGKIFSLVHELTDQQ